MEKTLNTQAKTLNKFAKFHKPGTSEYTEQADKFLANTGTTLDIVFKRHGKQFNEDTQTRDIYEITLKRGNRKYTFDFGSSIINSGIVHAWGLDVPSFRHNGKNCYASHYCSNINSFVLMNEFELLEKRVKPSSYSILAGLTKYDPDTFENFCDEFGYDTDSKKAEKTYQAVLNEWLNVSRLFNDTELRQLQEIQ